MPVDRFYTPVHLAEELVASVTNTAPALIADFAAGEGSLLQAAARRWPSAVSLALDHDRNAIRRLRRAAPRWLVGKCDFLRAESRGRCRALESFVGGVDVVLLNPPFSYRGGEAECAVLSDGTRIRCSPAAAFLLYAIELLAPLGEIAALMPASFLHSERDELARRQIARSGTLERIADRARGTFNGCYSRTVQIHFVFRETSHSEPVWRLSREAQQADSHTGADGQAKSVAMVRGTVQMPALNLRGGRLVRFAHTTELQRGTLEVRFGRIAGAARGVAGPCVLVPRVGEPSSAKVATYFGRDLVFLSDCVIGLTCESADQAEALREIFVANWKAVAKLYAGTGARYTTMQKVSVFLQRHGYRVATTNRVFQVDHWERPRRTGTRR